jgi:RimJ/RimL family protein N-acetyltransferase
VPVDRADYHLVVELLRTQRTVLRSWRQDEVLPFFDLYSRWEVMRWLGTPPRRAIADLAEARERLGRWLERQAGLAAPQGRWALVPRTGPAGQPPASPVGTILLLPLDDDTGPAGEVEIGWHLRPDYQGRGLATEAAQALLGAAARAGYERVLALTDPDNAASQAVAGRLGLADEGLTGRWFGLTTRQYAWTAPPRR